MKITTIDGEGNFVQVTYKVKTLKAKPAKFFSLFHLSMEEKTEEVRIMPNGTIKRITTETIIPEKRKDVVNAIIDAGFATVASIYDTIEDETYCKVFDGRMLELAKNRFDIGVIVRHLLSVFKTESIDDNPNEFFGLDEDTDVEIPEITLPYDDTDD